ncbi:hypothetical protein TNCV_668051 [Trichonephila clavipes]|nr:hypothetical protein TNCV_668051 [Trichonephila clavipes]
MRTIGQGYAAMITSCGVRDFSSPVAGKSYNSIINKLQLYSKEVAEVSMQSAALEEVTLTNSSDIILLVEMERGKFVAILLLVCVLL